MEMSTYNKASWRLRQFMEARESLNSGKKKSKTFDFPSTPPRPFSPRDLSCAFKISSIDSAKIPCTTISQFLISSKTEGIKHGNTHDNSDPPRAMLEKYSLIGHFVFFFRYKCSKFEKHHRNVSFPLACALACDSSCVVFFFSLVFFLCLRRLASQGAEESNSTEISVKFTVSMDRHSILLFKAPYVTSVLVMQSCYAC